MSSRVYFDQHSIQKDFASFTTDDLYGSKSFFGSLKSAFSKESESWNSAFHVASNDDKKLAVLIVGPHMYLISLETNRILKYTELPVDVITSVAFTPSVTGPVIFANKKLMRYSKVLALLMEEPVPGGVQTVFSIHGKLIGLKKSTLIELENKKELSIPQWKQAFASRNTIALVNDSEINFVTISRDFGVFKNGKLRLDKAIVDVTFSKSKVLVLDSDSVITVVNGETFEKMDAFEAGGTTTITSWEDTHVVASDECGSLMFFSLSNHQAQQQSIRARSVVRKTPSGFLLMEPQDEAGDCYHFDLTHFASVSPFDLYKRNCEQGFFGDALVLMRTFQFDKDVYYQAYLQQNELTVRAMAETIPKISNHEWIYNFCINTISESIEVNAKLIQFGLEAKPNDARLLRFRERLPIFTRLFPDGFSQKEWLRFRDCDLEEEVEQYIQKQQFVKVSRIFKDSSELNNELKLKIVGSISPFVSPFLYQDVLPNDPEWFRNRVMEIDSLTGQSSIVVELLQVGSRTLPVLKEDLELATEFDNYISVGNDHKTAVEMSYADYLNMEDEQRLALFASGKSGSELANILANEAKTIVRRDKDNLKNLLLGALLDPQSCVFESSGIIEKIAQVGLVLERQPAKFSQEIVAYILKNFSVEITVDIVSAINSAFGKFMSDSDRVVLKCANLSVRFNRPIIYTELKLDVPFFMKIADVIIKNPKDTWNEFSDIVSEANALLIKSDELTRLLSEWNLRVMITLWRFDSIEITTPGQRDIAIDMAKVLLSEATTCDIKDSTMNAAYMCILKIPVDMMNSVAQDLLSKFQLYQCIADVDKDITPSSVHSNSESSTNLILSIVDRKVPTSGIPEFSRKIKDLAMQLGGVDMSLVHNKFAEVCLRDGYDYRDGLKYLKDATQAVQLEYLRKGDFHGCESMCNEAITTCPDTLLAGFLDWKIQKSIPPPKTPLEMIEAAARTNNPKLTAFAFRFLKPEERLNAMKQFSDSAVDSGQFMSIATTLKNAGVIDEAEYEQYHVIASEKVVSGGSIDDQYKAIIDAEQKGLTVQISTKCRIFTEYFLKDADPTIVDNFSVEKAIAVITSRQGMIKDSVILTLAKLWHDGAMLTPESVEALALTVAPKKLSEHREFWSSVMDETIEMSVLQKSNNIDFGLSSRYDRIITAAYDLMKREGNIPDAVFNRIIERKEAHLFVNTEHFNNIVAKAKSKVQFRGIFESLERNNQRDALVKFIVSFFEIPQQFANVADQEAVIERARAILKD